MDELFQKHGIYEKIKEAVFEERYTIEEISNYCRNLDIDLKSLYFRGFTWNEIDLFKGDATELIPYIIPYLKEKVNIRNSSYEVEINKLTRNKHIRNKFYRHLYNVGI